MSGRVAGQSALFPISKPAGKHGSIDEQLERAGFPPADTEFPFAKSIGRNWRFDFAWVPQRIALEIEGGGFGRYIVVTSGYERKRGESIPIAPGTALRFGGRHNSGEGMEQDIEKYNTAAVLGWLVLRATTRQVRDGQVVQTLREAFRLRGLEVK